MKFTGHLKEPIIDYETGRLTLLFEPREDFRKAYDELKGEELLSLEIGKYRERRSTDANALLWHCLGEISRATGIDHWDLYLQALRDHGQYTYILVKENAVEDMKKQWRECEIVGDYEVNGQKAVQMLCYYGSSTYDTKQFSQLLDGVIQDMADLGLETPTSEEMRRSLEEWEKHHNRQPE